MHWSPLEPLTISTMASMRPRRKYLGCAGEAVRGALRRSASMRPRRKYLGCDTCDDYKIVEFDASMRPRRKYLGCDVEDAVLAATPHRFNEAEA